MKYEAINTYSREHSVRKMCQILNLAEGAYYQWVKRKAAKEAKQANQDDNQRFSMRGDFYQNVFSPEVNFMRGRKSNFQFVDKFDPMETINHYTEANAYQYSTFVPQDIEGLIELMGGDKVFENWLDSCFSVRTDFSKIKSKDSSGSHTPEM